MSDYKSLDIWDAVVGPPKQMKDFEFRCEECSKLCVNEHQSRKEHRQCCNCLMISDSLDDVDPDWQMLDMGLCGFCRARRDESYQKDKSVDPDVRRMAISDAIDFGWDDHLDMLLRIEDNKRVFNNHRQLFHAMLDHSDHRAKLCRVVLKHGVLKRRRTNPPKK